MIQKSNEVHELFAALSLAQGQFDAVVKNKANHFKSNYADLAACIDATRPHLSNNGLAVIQMVEGAAHGSNGVTIVTMLTHSSGQFISSALPVEFVAKLSKQDIANGVDPASVKMDCQDMGILITYARRYTYAALLSIAQEDNDGQGNIKEHKKELTDYTDERFEANTATWQEAIKAGKHTVESIHAFVKSKGQRFSTKQLETMKGWK